MAMDITLTDAGGSGAPKGAKTTFAGTSSRAGQEHAMQVEWVKTGLVVPKHLLTKKNAGEKQHKAFEFCLEVDHSTPLWAQAAVLGDTIEALRFNFWHINDMGEHEIYFAITLQGVQISGFDITTGKGTPEDQGTSRAMGDVSSKEKVIMACVFDSVTWEHVVGTVTMAQDSWTGKF